MKVQQSIREAYVEASSFLKQHDVMEPESNARLLLEWVLGLSGAAYYMALPEPFPQDKCEIWEHVIQRKAAGEPAQYIIGEQEFYGEVFIVTPSVLIPRPETELLVESVTKLAADLAFSQVEQELPDNNDTDLAHSAGDYIHSEDTDAIIQQGITDMQSQNWQSDTTSNHAHRPVCVDIGTGSGAIALTLARMMPDWDIWASDISLDALQVARQNSERQQTPIHWEQGNLLEPFAGRRVDIVVSNPPYIPDDDIAGLQPEVRLHEPLSALAGGPDGLGPYRIMMEQLSLLSGLPAMVAFELGQGQAQDVADMVRTAGYDQIHIIKDLAGIERHVIGML
ncbi:N5-glutamine methyltransferase family protein [Paenibacillus sp. WLX2291]|uniref:N5-glutamine methyltransferase family protein n=1 Tax=Paenibacillus sp. WLX2291 TaxID=3296934 RepID=UPI003983FAC9